MVRTPRPAPRARRHLSDADRFRRGRGRPGHDIAEHALTALRYLEHRGAVGAEEDTRDGYGIMVQLPDAFLREVSGLDLPLLGSYVAGTAFIPRDETVQRGVFAAFEAAAQQLTRGGHSVVVLEREDRLGGLLRYGIPEFKLEERRVDRRLQQTRAGGTRVRTDVDVGGTGENAPTVEDLRSRFDAVVVATGADTPRELRVPGREATGIHAAMDYLTQANRLVKSDWVGDPTSA